MNGEHTPEYLEKLGWGLKYQDFISDQLSKQKGIALSNYSARERQEKTGENRQGFEIKGDFKFQSRGFLWIEYAEKANAANPFYVPSGICRRDNSWFFIIGDWTRCYVFGRRMLRFICRYKNFERVQSPTSQAYAMPITEAEKWCEGRLEFGEKDDPSPFLVNANFGGAKK